MKYPKPKAQFIVCMDVGYRNTGLAAFNRVSGTFQHLCYVATEKDATAQYRTQDHVSCCRFIYSSVLSYLTKIGLSRIHRIVAELPVSGGKSASAHSAMGMSIAITSSVIQELQNRGLGIEFTAITPMEIKHLVRRKGIVSKEEIQNLIEKRYGKILPKKKYMREHIADAMACMEVLKSKI